VKYLKSLQTLLPESTIRSTLCASWGFLILTFAAYSAYAWLQTSDRLLTHLESLSQVIMINTQQQAHKLYADLNALEIQLQNNDANLRKIKPIKPINYDYIFLSNAQGQITASTFNDDVTFQFDLTEPLFSPDVLQQLLSEKEIIFAPTISLGAGNSSQYLPICKVIEHPTSPLLCLAISIENEVFNWHAFKQMHNTAIRIISGDHKLLYADPLPMHKRSLLGKKIQTRLIDQELRAENIRQQGGDHFHNQAGLDNIRRLGVIQYLEEQDLFIVLSVPIAQKIITWLKQISIPFIMLLAFFAINYIFVGFSIRLSRQLKENKRLNDINTREQENTLQLLTSNLPGIIYRVRIPDYKVLFITEGCHELLGYSANVYLSGQKTPFDDIHEDDQELLVKHANSMNGQQSNYEHIFRINNPNGEVKWVMDRGRAIKQLENRSDKGNDKNGHGYLEGILVDITEHMHSQQQVEYLSTRDPLTELANRYLFNDELVNHIDRHRDNTSIALLFIDLDRFKTINDSLGHQIGDRLLKIVAQRLKDCIDNNDVLARLGGDEFMIMMKNPSSIEAVEILAKSINSAINKSYEIDYYNLNTSCSIGISMYPQNSLESHILLRDADTAMYSAKAKGGNSYQFYTDEMNQKVNSRLTIENELRRAIQENEFEVHYQPQVNSHTGKLEGAEALIRWTHPTAGLVSPIEFIPIAEETGLIKDIGDWVLDQACNTFQKWNLEAGLNLTVAVNVSAVQLNDEFVSRVQEILKDSGFSSDHLELEITESMLMDNVKENIRILENISQQGVRFAMDDFGTGYSSLSYLRQFPINKLKIDRSFVNDITDDSDDEAIIRAIIAMGQTLKLQVIAEGVENQQQLALLQSMGCDSYQGYYFSKPLAVDDFYKKYIQSTTAES
jgi:diguanylate cyclase (GGDEF)-like protein